MNAKRILLVVVVLIALIAAGASLVYAQSHLPDTGSRVPRSLAGSWIVKVIPDPATGVPPFINYSVMTGDGRVINSNDFGHASVGEWIRPAVNRFAVTFMGSEISDGQLSPYKVRATVQFSQDGEEFTGPFVTDIFDADGNLVFTITGTIQATRIHVEPLD